MASTFSNLLRLELMASGENDDTWGDKANDVFEKIEKAAHGMATLTITGDTTVGTANGGDGSTDDSNNLALKLGGTPAGAFNLTIPAKTHSYIIWNASGQVATVKTSTSTTTVAIEDARIGFVFCDGTDVYAVSPLMTTTGGPHFRSLAGIELLLSGDTNNDGIADDVQFTWALNGSDQYTRGVDDSDSDALVSSLGGTLGTNNFERVSSAGEVTHPLKPAFYAYLSANAENVTGNSTAYAIVFDSERFDQNADFNISTGVFTAPVTGKYQLNANVRLTQLGTATQVNLEIVASNETVLQIDAFVASTFTTKGSTLSTLVDMDAADTAFVRVTVIGTGADTADVITSGRGTSFSGFLAC